MFTYSFSNTDLLLNLQSKSLNEVIKVEGFKAGDDLITIARKAPIATTDFSAYGDMVVSMQRNLSVDLVFPLLQNSPENVKLQTWANEFQSSAYKFDGTFITPIQGSCVDNMGNDKAVLSNGVILAIPALTRGLTVATVTWVISFEAGKITREGAVDLSSGQTSLVI